MIKNLQREQFYTSKEIFISKAEIDKYMLYNKQQYHRISIYVTFELV